MSKFLQIDTKGILEAVKNFEKDNEEKLKSMTAYTAKQMAKKAQKGFNRAKYDGTNDVYCYAVQTNARGKQLCAYNIVAYSPSGSVAFIEFGAGTGKINSFTEPNPFRKTVKPQKVIKELGQYGKGRGMQDYWIFTNTNISLTHATPNLAFVVDRQGNPRPNTFWTGGNKPARAMWGARLDFDKKFNNWVDIFWR